ncbi:MAG: STAS domain-containing protein [Candidatus Tectomicrobia bacterium]|nr:STAS domain-containing protein [Candidatus Tectomicrobia bacterium]
MKVPILRQGSVLIAAVQAAFSDRELLKLRDDLVATVGQSRSPGLVIDVTSLDLIDSFACRTFRELAQMTRLRGTKTVIVGVQPQVAVAMAQLGVRLEDLTTALDLEEAIQYLQRHRGEEVR